MKRILIAAAVAALAVATIGVPALAGSGTRTCTGTLAPGTYQRVVVPAGAVCLSNGPVTIHAGLFVRPGATLVFGSEENPVHTATIGGGVHATDPASVQIHFSTIRGGIDISGGSGPFGGPFGVTWTTIEDSSIRGAVSITGYNGFWGGFIRNDVRGSVSYNHNTLTDPDGNEVVTNTIHGSLSCFGNRPAPQIGDSQGSLNLVTGAKVGQCRNV